MEHSVTIEFAGRPLTISTGLLAKQADGSVLVKYADTVVLVTAVADRKATEKDFLPLTVNYQEMSYAAGRFPGGFFKREGRPSTQETLTARLTDRPLRPLFQKDSGTTQVIATVLSSTRKMTRDFEHVSVRVFDPFTDPWLGPLAAVRMVGRMVVIANRRRPRWQRATWTSLLGTKDAIIMVRRGPFCERCDSSRLSCCTPEYSATDRHAGRTPGKGWQGKWTFQPIAVPEELVRNHEQHERAHLPD
jgi:polyribonucleotide nucleotidyltransferase